MNEHLFAAGGVVYKKENGVLFILVSQHSLHHGWVFPKGIIGDKHENEDKESTALREVKEETGVDAEIIQPLEPITYLFEFENHKNQKTVNYFIMRATGGDITQHDHEMEAVEWLSSDKVMDRLTYDSDKQVYKKALPIIQKLS